MRPLAPALILATACVAACATSGGPDSPRTRRDAITAEEMAPFSGTSAFNAIEALRPEWLQARRGTDPPRFLLNGLSATPDEVRALPAAEIREMRLLSAALATTRYGAGFPGGAIEIRTMR